MQKITAVAFLYNEWKLFIAKRSEIKKFLPWKYELPWGHIEFGETMDNWLKREMKEEFGIDVIIEKPFYVFTYTNQDNTKHTVEIVYFVKLQQLDQKIILNEDDHSEYRWITKKEITKYFQKNDEELNAGIKWFEILEQK